MRAGVWTDVKASETERRQQKELPGGELVGSWKGYSETTAEVSFTWADPEPGMVLSWSL